MEDLETEWEIQEYPSSKEGETTMVRWMLNKGYGIGKKMVITGIAVSSAPLVLPPLVVFSVMGVAFSVPFGLVFVSYACTNKLMSRLLPPPLASPSRLLEYYGDEDDEEKEQEWELRREYVIQYWEDDQLVDIKQEIDEGSITNFNGVVDEQGYEEDVGEYVEGDDDSFEEERKEEESLMEENNRNTREVTEDGKEEIVEVSTGLLKKIRDEVKIDNTVKDDSFVGENGSHGVIETRPVIVKEIEAQKLSKNEDEPVGEMRRVVVLAGGNEENNFSSREVEELDLMAREVVVDTGKEGRKTESKEKVMRESMGSQETINGAALNDEREDAILSTKKDHPMHSNVREIDGEAGLDFDNRNEASYQHTDVNNRSLEDDDAKDNVVDNVDVASLPAFKRPLLDSDHAKVASKADTKGFLDEEKIWEQIGAMRAIVGYQAPSQPTCIEEVKALYVFTGVEPPTSIKGDSDLDEVNTKLKFLMSIVGVR